ncbi:SusC/RagA family TonB-linked outer membrane protein [uncultured Chitinophaga sp.]|uniref:SusC/RagA family TonB-linked outer membrane protein n=1 Tax=uncultured Chitinophaga sp. TaxID=339340 RepID=UPI0025F67366|nr:SusC/RagA family TonB-linked outer membrane protein [uncultured Chitinophaga sp.]
MMKRMGLIFLRKDRMFHAPLLRFVLLLGFLLAAGNGFGQNGGVLSQKITFRANKASISNVLKQVRSQTKVRFTYNSELVGRQQPVTINVTEVTLREFLQQLLSNTGLQFAEEMGGILIYEKKEETIAPGSKLTVVVRGRVADEKGDPLAGVSIRGLESQEMTTTGADGLFMLMVNEKETVSFSLIGMKTYAYKALTTNNSLLQIKMDPQVSDIQEVVVNGYQKIDPRLSTGSYLKLTAAEILQPGAPSIDRMLQGKVPGLMILNTSGGANAKPTMRIRGTSTIMGNAAPLLVIDGMIRPDPAKINPAQLTNIMNDAASSNFDMLGNAFSGLNPFDIESVNFLRDAAATAIYGTRAANGVIVVTTKRGKAGNTQITYNANASFQSRPSYRNLELMNSKERILLTKQLIDDNVLFLATTSGFDEEYSYAGLLRAMYGRRITEDEFYQKVGELETKNTDWFGELFRNQISTQHSLSMSGGIGKTTYYLSANYGANNGAAKLDGNKKYGANLNIRTEVGKRITLDVSLASNVLNTTGYYGTVNPLTYALQTTRTIDADQMYPIGRQAALGTSTADLTQYPNLYYFNMNNEIAHSENNAAQRSTTLNVSLDYKIGKGWYFRNLSSIIYDNMNGFTAADEQTTAMSQIRSWAYGDTPTPFQFQVSKLPAGGIAQMTTQSNRTWSTRNSLDYSRSLFKDRDQLNFTLGNEIQSHFSESFLSIQPGYFPERGKVFYATDLSRRELSKTRLLEELNNTVSYYATAAYSLMNRYVLSGTIRSDGSNRFGQYSKSKFLPNYVISGRWNTEAEKWFPTNGPLSGMQVRVSWGTQGNLVEDVGPDLVATYEEQGNATSISVVPLLRIKSLPYPDLRWEKTYQLNVGTTLAFFNNRVRLGFEYYDKKSVDVLENVKIPYEYGQNMMYRNGSELYNKGVEAMLNMDLIRKRTTTLSVTLNTSRNLNRKDENNVSDDYYSLFTGAGSLAGRPVSGFYSYVFKGLNHNSGLPMFDKLDRATKTTDPNEFLVYSGQRQPKASVTMIPTFRYKSFTVNMLVYVSLGSTKRLNTPFVQTNSTNNVPAPFANVGKAYLDRWRKPGDEAHTNTPVLIDRVPMSEYLQIPYYAGETVYGYSYDITVNPMTAYASSDYFAVKNNYLRCNYINLGYNVPGKRLMGSGIKNLVAGFTVNNPFVIANSRLKGQDPEIDGVGTTALPITRQYVLSITAGF